MKASGWHEIACTASDIAVLLQPGNVHSPSWKVKPVHLTVTDPTPVRNQLSDCPTCKLYSKRDDEGYDVPTGSLLCCRMAVSVAVGWELDLPAETLEKQE
jgi:hypothetical protein